MTTEYAVVDEMLTVAFLGNDTHETQPEVGQLGKKGKRMKTM